MLMTGNVALVGAGPGDPELITVKGLNRLRDADVVAYDRLVHPDLLREAPLWAERIYVGKESGSGQGQEDIEQLLIASARQGRRVVRLKGGDPFVFGRGGEEMAALVTAGVPLEVVPGVSSAIAAPALAGIPVTHREYSSSVTFVTGHEDPDKPDELVDWNKLASSSGTLVILMGLGRLRALCTRLTAAGRPGDTPAAVIASASLPDQQTVTAPLGELATVANVAGLQPPAVIVVGDVVGFSASLGCELGDLLAAIPEQLTLND